MNWKLDNNRPIYIQIVEILKNDIITNKYALGQKFPTVRELAQIFSVNPNTIQRSLIELERLGYVETHRTSGRVISANHEKLAMDKKSISNQKISDFLTQMYELGFSKEEIIILIKEDLTNACRN